VKWLKSESSTSKQGFFHFNEHLLFELDIPLRIRRLVIHPLLFKLKRSQLNLAFLLTLYASEVFTVHPSMLES